MQFVLNICLSSKQLFDYALPANAASDGNNTALNQNANEELLKHMLLFESRLQNALKTLIKLLLSSKDPKKLSELYKRMYMETLRVNKSIGEQNQTVEEVAVRCFSLLERLNQMENSVNSNNNVLI